MERRTRLTAGVLLLGTVAVAAWLVSPGVALAEFEALADQPALFALAVLAVAMVRPLFAWPTLVLSIAVGYAAGFAGLPLVAVALVVTAIPPYQFGLSATGSGRLTAAGERFLDETGGVRGVTAARLFPVPSDAVSAAAGAIGVPRRPFLVGTLLGELPWAVLGITVGRSAEQLTTAGLSGAVGPWLLAGMSAVAILLLAGPCYRLLSERQSPVPGPTE